MENNENRTRYDIQFEKFKVAVKKMLVGGTSGGLVGATIGTCLATVRHESIKFYAASMGGNFFLITAVFITLEESLADILNKRDYITGALAGAGTGGGLAGLAVGRVRGLQGAGVGAVIGAGSVFAREQFERWRISKGVERYEEKYGKAPAMFYPSTDILVETKGPVKKLEFPSLLPKTVKTSEEEIERRILKRVEELQLEEEERLKEAKISKD